MTLFDQISEDIKSVVTGTGTLLHEKIPQTLFMGCSMLAHGLLMGLSWAALCELYLQGHEFAMIIACDHRDFCLSAIGQPYDDNMPLFCNNTMLFGNNGMFSDS